MYIYTNIIFCCKISLFILFFYITVFILHSQYSLFVLFLQIIKKTTWIWVNYWPCFRVCSCWYATMRINTKYYTCPKHILIMGHWKEERCYYIFWSFKQLLIPALRLPMPRNLAGSAGKISILITIGIMAKSMDCSTL